MTLNVWPSNNGQFYFTVNSSNGQVLATSETYVRKTDCVHAANLIKVQASDAPVYDRA